MIRIMKGDDHCVYVVAKDLCLLLNVRKNNVSKFIRYLPPRYRPKMSVQCYRTDGKLPVQSLTVLTLEGVKSLLATAENTKRVPNIQSVNEWLTCEIPELSKVDSAR